MIKLVLIIFLISSNVFAKVPNFTLPIYKSEKNFKLSEHIGKKTIVINFWASWCTSCIQEIPILHKLKKENPKVMFLAMSAGDKKHKIRKFLKKTKFNYTVLMDVDKKVSASFGVSSLPQTIVISKKGAIVYQKHVPPTKTSF